MQNAKCNASRFSTYRTYLRIHHSTDITPNAHLKYILGEDHSTPIISQLRPLINHTRSTPTNIIDNPPGLCYDKRRREPVDGRRQTVDRGNTGKSGWTGMMAQRGE